MTVAAALSDRLLRMVDALPLRPGMRVLEIGGAPGTAAREVAARVSPDGHVLVLDRSAAGVRRTRANCATEVAARNGPDGHVLVLDRSAAGIGRTRTYCAAEFTAGLLSTLRAPVEDFELDDGTAPFDLAFACRVGALDGRHPSLYEPALACLRRAVVPGGVLYVDTGSPLTAVSLR